MAYSSLWLMGSDAANKRQQRANAYPCGDVERLRFVVWVEVKEYYHQELDAESIPHAVRLALDWVQNGRCISASIRAVNVDGSLPRDTIAMVALDDRMRAEITMR